MGQKKTNGQAATLRPMMMERAPVMLHRRGSDEKGSK